MTGKKWIRWTEAVGVGAVALVLGYSVLGQKLLHGGTASGRVPFVAKVAVRSYDAAGQLTMTEMRTEAVRGDGSDVWVRETQNGRPLDMRVVRDLSRGVRVSVEPRTRSLTTYKLTAREKALGYGWRASAGCKLGPWLERATGDVGTMLGYNVVKGAETMPPAGPGVRVEREVWMAPRLGCYPLSAKMTKYEDGQMIQWSLAEVVSIEEQEPDPALFVLPADYTERKPSEVLALLPPPPNGRPCTACATGANKVLDQAYASRH